MYSLAVRVTLAALTIASAASMAPMRPRVSIMPSASAVMRIQRGENRRKANILKSMRQYGSIAPRMRKVAYGALAIVGAVISGSSLPGCSNADTAPPVATVSFTSNKAKVPLGSPVELTYQFDVAPDAKID